MRYAYIYPTLSYNEIEFHKVPSYYYDGNKATPKTKQTAKIITLYLEFRLQSWVGWISSPQELLTKLIPFVQKWNWPGLNGKSSHTNVAMSANFTKVLLQQNAPTCRVSEWGPFSSLYCNNHCCVKPTIYRGCREYLLLRKAMFFTRSKTAKMFSNVVANEQNTLGGSSTYIQRIQPGTLHTCNCLY